MPFFSKENNNKNPKIRWWESKWEIDVHSSDWFVNFGGWSGNVA